MFNCSVLCVVCLLMVVHICLKSLNENLIFCKAEVQRHDFDSLNSAVVLPVFMLYLQTMIAISNLDRCILLTLFFRRDFWKLYPIYTCPLMLMSISTNRG